MEIGLKIFAVVLLGISVYFYSNGETDRTFAAVIVAICSYFVSMRFGAKARLDAAVETTEKADEVDE